MQIGVLQKARIITKELGKALTEEQLVKYPQGAKFIDEVLLTNKIGQKVRINSIRSEDGTLLRRFTYKGNSICQKDYSFGGTGENRFKEINTIWADRKRDILAKLNEIFSFGTTENGKTVLTKSKLYQTDFANYEAQHEICGISQFENGKPAKFYVSNIQRDCKDLSMSQITAQARVSLAESTLKNENLHTLQYNTRDFCKEVFNTALKKNGLENKGIMLETAELEPFKKGIYRNRNKLVVLGLNNFKTRYSCVGTINHELTHANQYREVEFLEAGKLSGERMKRAELLKHNLENHIKPAEDFEKYKTQLVEAEARSAGEAAAEEYKMMQGDVLLNFSGGNVLPNQIGWQM